MNCLFGLLLVLGVSTVFSTLMPKILSFLLVIVAIVIKELRFRDPSQWLSGLDLCLSGLFFLMFSIVILRRVFSDGESNIHRLQGAIAGFLLIAFLFGHIFSLILFFIPGSFVSSNLPLEGEQALNSMIYFSSITITTTGFGDIVPIHPIARSLVTLEAFFGIFFPGIMIASLVSLMVQERKSPSTER